MTHPSSRRHFIAGIAGTVAAAAAVSATSAAPSPDDLARHERYMQMAIDAAKQNPARPFGSVIVDQRSGTVVGRGVVNMRANPTFHSEIAAMNDYIAHHGNQGWNNLTMYGTGESCPMCMSAMIWAGIPRIVYASEMPFVAKYVKLIALRCKDVIAAAAPGLYTSELVLGGVLSPVTDAMFANRYKYLSGG
ncbi:MAG TPA: nucleoside deaminase [Candidatus Dormibacteraeota bacterium]|nr:nucleoside deaminase [Candidatus Dormibacteraeota bacterium]